METIEESVIKPNSAAVINDTDDEGLHISFNEEVKSDQHKLNCDEVECNLSIDFITEREITELIDSTIIDNTEDVQYICEELNYEKENICDLLRKILVEQESLVDEFAEADRKHKKYPMEVMYCEKVETLKVKMQVQLTLARSDIKDRQNKLMQKTFQNSNRKLLIPTCGDDKSIYDSLTEKLLILKQLETHFIIG